MARTTRCALLAIGLAIATVGWSPSATADVGTVTFTSVTTLPPFQTSSTGGRMSGRIDYTVSSCTPGGPLDKVTWYFTVTEGGGSPYQGPTGEFSYGCSPASDSRQVDQFLVTPGGSTTLATGTTYTYYLTACEPAPSTECVSGEVVSYTPGGPAPDTTITSGPTGTIRTSSAAFGFSSPTPGTSFECRVDTGPYAACTSPVTVSGLLNGAHTFRVRAKNGNGTDPTPAERSFVVDAPDAAACAAAQSALAAAQRTLSVARSDLKAAERAVDRAKQKLQQAEGERAKAKAQKKLKQAKKRERAAKRAVEAAAAAEAAARAARDDACR